MSNAKRHAQNAIVGMYHSLYDYAGAHQEMYDSPIGEDYVLGPCFADMVRGLLGLLNGETGTLDCGEWDAQIRRLATENGIDGDTL